MRAKRSIEERSRGLHGSIVVSTKEALHRRIVEVADTERAPFVGTVQRATFLGSVVEYEVSVEGLSPLLVQTSNPLEGRIHKVGSSVRVDFPPGTLHVLAPE